MIEMVEQWYKETYSLPSNHDCFLDRTLHEHLVDMFETVFLKKPLEMHRQSDGEYQFTETGDKLIDQWEEQIAAGHIPDLLEAFKQSDLERMDFARKQLASGRHIDPAKSRSFKEVIDDMAQEASSVVPQKRRRTFGG